MDARAGLESDQSEDDFLVEQLSLLLDRRDVTSFLQSVSHILSELGLKDAD